MHSQKDADLTFHDPATQRLIDVVQELSLARDLASIMQIVRCAARDLTGADGATFVLRDGTQCFYADENAISPLWKGQRFPMSACISGWAMLNKRSVAITDIYADPRIPADAYRPTFVKSLAMVPIRTANPVGAIGNYWAQPHTPTRREMDLLERLANTTAVAIENVHLYSELEQRVVQRTEELQAANRELEAFSYAVSHDLRAPLRNLSGLLQIVTEDAAKLPAGAVQCIARAQDQARRMNELINDLLRLSQINQAALQLEEFDLSQLVAEVLDRLRAESPQRVADIRIQDELRIIADRGLLSAAVENLVCNAWKYCARRPITIIEFGVTETNLGQRTYFLRDNGVGFKMSDANKLFQPFQRLGSAAGFPGSGIGLATVRRIVERHGGKIWAQAAEGEGATFYCTLNAEEVA